MDLFTSNNNGRVIEIKSLQPVLAGCRRGKLGGVGEEVADFVEVDLKGPRHLLGRWAGEKFAGEGTGIGAEVIRDRTVRILEGFFNDRDVARFFADGDFHARAHLEGADVYFLAVDMDMSMRYQLLGSKDSRGKF